MAHNPDQTSAALTQGSPAPRAWFTAPRLAGVIAVLLFVAYPQILPGAQSFFFRDFALFGYPLAHFHKECFWQMEWPLWNPYNECGHPFLAQWNTLTLYPGTLIYLLLPEEFSVSLFCLLHLVWAGAGMFVLVRHWTNHAPSAAIAGAAFVFNGLTLACLMWPNNAATLAWMPWVFYAARRGWREGGRWVIWGALAAALQLLAGTPEFILFTWGIIGSVWLIEIFTLLKQGGRRSSRLPGGGETFRPVVLLRLPAVVLLASALAAAQLLPFAELLAHSHRGAGYADDSWAMPPWGWANLVLPQFHMFRWNHGVLFQPEQGWTSSYYPGIGVLLLAWMAVCRIPNAHTRLFGQLIPIFLVLALGPAGHLYAWIKMVFPPIQTIRFPVKFVVPAIFLWPLLAGLAWAHLNSVSPSDDRRQGNRCLYLGAAGLATAILGLWAFAVAHPYGNGNVAGSALSRLGLLLTFAIIALVVQQGRLSPVWRNRATGAVILLIWLDAVTHLPSQNPTVEQWTLGSGITRQPDYPLPGQGRALTRHDTEYPQVPALRNDAERDVLSKRMGAYGNCNLLDRLPKLGGMFSLHVREMHELLALLHEQGNQPPAGLAAFLGLALEPAPGMYFRLSPRRQERLPLVTAGQRPLFAGPAETLAALFSTNFNPRAQVYLPLAAQPKIAVTNQARAIAELKNFQRHQLTIAVEAENPCWLVVAQSYYPAWQARLDGQPAAIWKANYAFQAVEVPAGRHEVIFRYRDYRFLLGLAISVSALFGVAVFLARQKTTCRTPSGTCGGAPAS